MNQYRLKGLLAQSFSQEKGETNQMFVGELQKNDKCRADGIQNF